MLCADENFFPWIDICAIQINKYYYYYIIVRLLSFCDETRTEKLHFYSRFLTRRYTALYLELYYQRIQFNKIRLNQI